MYLPPESDNPTRRLPPTGPAEPLREREVVIAEPDPVWVQEVLGRLRSLRTWVALVGVLALAALGVGLSALLTQEEEADARQSASLERVQELESRVGALESETEDAASEDAIKGLRDQQQALEKRLSAVEDQASDDSGVEDVQADVRQLSDAVDQIGQSIEQLDQRVGDLEQQQAQDSATP